jgi:mRNA interferase MazF
MGDSRGLAEVKLGDICWFVPSATGGHVQQGRRPGIIWLDQSRFPNLPTTLAIPLTSQQAALRFGACHLLQPTPKNGLSVPSVALVFQITAVDPTNIGTKLGELDDADRIQLQAVTRAILGLP